MTILSKFRNSSQPQTIGNLALKVEKPSPEFLPDQETISEWLAERSSITEFDGKLSLQEADKLAAVDGSNESRQEAAREAVELAREAWERRISELVGQGIGLGEARQQAGREVRESAIWREGREI